MHCNILCFWDMDGFRMSCRDGRLSCVVAVWLPSELSGEALGRISELLRGVVGVGKRRLDSAILYEYDLSSPTRAKQGGCRGVNQFM